MDTGLAGKGVLVTGGAGGIGSACVRAFAAEGARVAIHYRASRERAEELAAETGGVAIGADLTDEAAVDALFARAREELGTIDVCAAVAGRHALVQPLEWSLQLVAGACCHAEDDSGVAMSPTLTRPACARCP